LTAEPGRRSLVVATPVGRLELVEAGGALVAIRFDAPPDGSDAARRGSAVLDDARRQLEEYVAGTRRVFDLPLRPPGTEFQRRVWQAVARLPWGTTTTYGALARDLGLPVGAARAVGAANGANPLPIVVPCHRVVGSDGRLTGYAGGLARKDALLVLEGVRGIVGQGAAS
jgi:methylated-DNA-[protein]-cysteine S-methyltransferase